MIFEPAEGNARGSCEGDEPSVEDGTGVERRRERNDCGGKSSAVDSDKSAMAVGLSCWVDDDVTRNALTVKSSRNDEEERQTSDKHSRHSTRFFSLVFRMGWNEEGR